jgi:hypothetical protein
MTFYGTAKPTIEEMREKENRILGTLDFHSPLLKPDWRISFKGDSIYRAREPNWLGKYQNSKEKFADYNTETKMFKGAEKQPATCILDQPILEVGRCLFCFLTYPLS